MSKKKTFYIQPTQHKHAIEVHGPCLYQQVRRCRDEYPDDPRQWCGYCSGVDVRGGITAADGKKVEQAKVSMKVEDYSHGGFTIWNLMSDPPDGVGGYVWVAYPNPNHPNKFNLRVQMTPIVREMAVEPWFWTPVIEPTAPREKK